MSAAGQVHIAVVRGNIFAVVKKLFAFAFFRAYCSRPSRHRAIFHRNFRNEFRPPHIADQATAAEPLRHGCVRPACRICTPGRRLHSRLIPRTGDRSPRSPRGKANALGFHPGGFFYVVRKGSTHEFAGHATPRSIRVHARSRGNTTNGAGPGMARGNLLYAGFRRRAWMLRQGGDGRPRTGIAAWRQAAMRSAHRRSTAARVFIPSGARGPAVAYAGDRAKAFHEDASSAGRAAVARPCGSVRVRRVHRWIAQSGRASV